MNKFKKILTNLLDQFLLAYFVFLLSFFITDFVFIFKEGISNLSVHSVIFIFLLGARWYLDKASFDNSLLVKSLKYISKLGDVKILWFLSLVLAFIFLYIGIMRHFAFSSAGIDMGVTDQAIWNTVKGRLFFSSIDGNINHLGAHFEPVLFLIAPLYFIWPNIIILIFLQAFAVGLAVFPLYLIAKERLKSRFLVFTFILAYFLSRPLRGAGLLDFHTDVFLIPLAFISYYLLITKRTFWSVIAIFLMLCCKESAAVLVFAYGIFSFICLKRYRFGLALLVLAIAWWAFVTNFVMPHFANTKVYPYLKWLPFGATYTENILAVIKNPALLINLFFSNDKLIYYAKLFVPLGMLSFLSPQHYVLFLLPIAFQAIGSINHPGMSTITSHYPAHVLPFIFISAICGAGRLVNFIRNKFPVKDIEKRVSICLAAIIIFLSLFFFGKSDGHKLSKFIHSAKQLHSSEIRMALKNIPEGASVSAVHRLVPHLTHRKYIYIWENSPDSRYLTKYVVLHRQLIESDKERFDQVIIELKERGFKEIYNDKYNDLFIFFNPMYKKEFLENRQGRIII
ncbi:MAG: DUF2079 domain-containing protein [Candidatus Omnitrophica bacterium]|nr:DUF2079 domain-containing protein [Candidatus Omnitrophota bacterium]